MEALIEKLEKICVEYNNQLSKYEALMYHTQRTNEKLEKYTESNREKVDRLYMRVESRLEKLDEHMDVAATEYQSLFEQYSKDINTLNEEEREAFLKLLLSGLEQYKVEFLQEVMTDYRDILQGFMQQIQEEAEVVGNGREDMEKLVKDAETMNSGLQHRIQELCISVDAATEKTNQILSKMNERYLAIFEEFSNQVNSVNEADRTEFLSELEAVLEKYKENYGTYDTLLAENKQLNYSLSKLTLQNTENMQALERQVEKELVQTERILTHISEAYEQGFAEFEKDVSVLNSREREALCVTIRTLLEEYRFSFGKEIEGKAGEMNLLFQNTLLGICNSLGGHYKEYYQVLEATRESNVELHRKLEGETDNIENLTAQLMRREAEIEKALEFLKEGYRETVQGYMREMQSANERAGELLQESMQRSVSGLLERFLHQLEMFKSERNVYLEQMEQLVEQERISREQLLESHERQLTLLGKKQILLQQQMEENQRMLRKSIVSIGTVIILLLSICILLVIPWGSSPIWLVAVLVIFVILGIFATVRRKTVIKWLKTIFLPAGLVVLGVSLTGCGQKTTLNKEVELQAENTRDVSYELTQVYRGTVAQIMNLRCVYKQTEEVEISFAVDQELITDVLVEKGDSVKKGELLAKVNIEATEDKLEELKHQLALNELYLQQTVEKRDFELEQADILFSYTMMTDKDKEALEEQKESITESYAGRIQDYEDTLYFERKRVQEYEEYVANGQIFAPMDGVVSHVRSDLEGSLSEKDSCIIRMYDPATKYYTSENVEAIPYLEADREYTISCGLGKGLREYTVVPVNMEQWGEKIFFRLLDEDYDPNNVVNGRIALTIEEKENALYLDDNAVHSSGEDYYVYTLDENSVRRMQFIEVGMKGNDIIEVVSGLEEGDRVILK